MDKTTFIGVTVSQVHHAHARRLYFLPFQTWRALRSALVWQAFGIAIIGAVKYSLAPANMLVVMIGGAFSGLLCSAYAGLPARLTLSTRSEARHHLADLQALLVKNSFVASDQPVLHGSYLYRGKLPRWLICYSQDNLKLEVRDHEIVLTAPILILHLLRAQLLRRDDYAFLKA
ncbi:hypothetical protein CR105_13555 [Massilia eurypsychrophila]|jgi:hypothetical protein|uniref:Uncharacterized protein n=1 Tax=Massilia eurypsychrophila TaxID=1485217 RepID=A0A2G8TEM1_9BURK|nr:hypothetical protein [Massilia eurypsychrophila]PIL44480.1 hypothetical protein CR105_13555 [Massilia eurypsychrophila]